MNGAELEIGVVGACGRGGSFGPILRAVDGVRVRAVCDTNARRLPEASGLLDASETYVDFEEMLERSKLDAVLIATPMPFHASQSIAALERGINVLCEVPAAVSEEECRRLAAACGRSCSVYMMAENYLYMRENVLVRELCRRKLFGEPYYAEGEYLHELKELNEATPWRRRWQTGIRGITYGTHSLGPILQWLGGDRVARVCCEGSGSHYRDPRGEPYHDDTAVMLAKTRKGALIKIRVDMVSDRPHAMTNYQLQGTDGAYESGRGGPAERGKIWFHELSAEVRWHDLGQLLEDEAFRRRYLPAMWRRAEKAAVRAGHGGGDYFVFRDFVDAVRAGGPAPIGIHEALDMTLPGLMSQRSIQEGGTWIDVPDCRAWEGSAGAGGPVGQLEMIWPEALAPPDPETPEGYLLRQLRESDAEGYAELMRAAGFTDWGADRLGKVLRGVLPEGFFVVEHRPSARIVATAIANHCPAERHPFGGELGWVAVAPEHRGNRLGRLVCSAVIRRFLSAGYRRIYLKTDDFRLPAIKVYLGLGFEPSFYREDMQARWRAVQSKFG